MVRTAPEQLGTDPLGMLLEIDEIARTAPPELAGRIAEFRDAVKSFRQGDESLSFLHFCSSTEADTYPSALVEG
ncbi:hypothetical protein [Arthrobacter sp. L77]|uniref:hypothetical protein n=1 Tax=Arthrobacter sp. L77 TaxID=1496689 RepID=UPI0012DFF276|nr:hypothetical protein [Arthrobacter sp. L77]